MTEITDPTLKRHVLQSREFAEAFLKMLMWSDEVVIDFDNNAAPLLENLNDADTVIDGLSDKGIAPISKDDLVAFMTTVKAVKASFSEPLEGGGTVRDLIRTLVAEPWRLDI